MKKTTKHPITFFREANEKRQKSLVKADDGIISKIGPKTEFEQMSYDAANDPMYGNRGPRTTPIQPSKPSLKDKIEYKFREIARPLRKSKAIREYQQVNSDKSKFRQIIEPILGAAATGVLGSKVYKTLKEQKKGGSVKAKKFAALAPPYDKPTAADRIAGAKKNARKKR